MVDTQHQKSLKKVHVHIYSAPNTSCYRKGRAVVVFEDMWHDWFLYGEGRGVAGRKLDEARKCVELVSKFVSDLAAALYLASLGGDLLPVFYVVP